MKKVQKIITLLMWMMYIMTTQAQTEADKPATYSLDPYTGPWTMKEAAHLLRRTHIGVPFSEIRRIYRKGNNKGVQKAVDFIFKKVKMEDPLVLGEHDGIIWPSGETWLGKKIPSGLKPQQVNRYGGITLYSTTATASLKLLDNRPRIDNKLFLFWINHFGASWIRKGKIDYVYWKLLMDNSQGNVKDIIKRVTVDPSMLFFLNGHRSGAGNGRPNENFARELMELYTLGEGNYTEHDVQQVARIMTGFQVFALMDDKLDVATMPYARYIDKNHDKGDKTLSHYFNNVTITNGGPNEYKKLIDIIFDNERFGYYFCSELYTFFVGEVTNEVRDQVIPQMRKTFVNNNFEIKPVLRQLFASEHFYDSAIRGSLIKSHLHILYGIYTSTNAKLLTDPKQRYNQANDLLTNAGRLGEHFPRPPTVSGWTAYYQQPSLHKLWIDTNSYGARNGTVARYTRILPITGFDFLQGLSDPKNLDQIIEDVCLLFFPVEVPQEDKDRLRSILGEGATQRTWRNEYSRAFKDSDPNVGKAYTRRVRRLLFAIEEMYMFNTY